MSASGLNSKGIVGWSLQETLHSKGPIAALKMALGKYTEVDQQLIHHSDRGMQYCCHEYIKLLKNITISMTHEGDPGENAIAERINGTIKNEFRTRC